MQWLVDARDVREIDRWDFLGFAMSLIGVVWGLVGLIVADYAGGFGLFAIGFLILTRHNPSGA